MGSVNKKEIPLTHGGSPASRINPELMLRRSVLSCFLWEKEFYEDGVSIAERIKALAAQCDPSFVYDLAMEARHTHGLRHVPLLLLLDLVARKDFRVREGVNVKHAVASVIRRPDELTELLAMYWKEKGPKVGTSVRTKLSDRQLRDGLALALGKFNEYSLAKYNRDGEVRLRDVLFLSHPKPKDDEQAALFKRLANNELAVPDTWEVELSAGKDKKATFERLIQEGKLGYMALLRNLRNMVQADCDSKIVSEAILAKKGAELVLPFRYTAAARAAPQYEKYLDEALQSTIKNLPLLKGRTLVLVDISGSMFAALSARSDLTRADAAATLASVINAEDLRVFSFSSKTVEVPARRGMAGVDAIIRSQGHASTNLSGAIAEMNKIPHDRLIVITDEQDTTWRPLPKPVCKYPYMINVASNRNGVGYGDWYKMDGFSESIIKYISLFEDMIENYK